MPYVIAVHAGAGYHSRKQTESYKKVLERACVKAASALDHGKDLLDAVCAAISVLEDSEITNAGKGSNLNIQGLAETDASVCASAQAETAIMGSVGAAIGVRNPIHVAATIARKGQESLPFGRVPPLMIVGEAVRSYAEEHGLQEPMDDSEAKRLHLTSKTQRRYQKYVDMMLSGEEVCPKRVFDTVGCVIADSTGLIAAGCSSGGVWLKESGRVGHAGICGLGCWSEKKDNISIACSMTGVGEKIIKHNLTRQCASEAVRETRELSTLGTRIHDTIENCLKTEPTPSDCGALVMTCMQTKESTCRVDLCATHVKSDSFAIGYLYVAQAHTRPVSKVIILRDPVRVLDLGVVLK